MQLQIVGRPRAYNGGFCGKKNKVKEELAHAFYNRKAVVIGIKVCITNDADKNTAIELSVASYRGLKDILYCAKTLALDLGVMLSTRNN